MRITDQSQNRVRIGTGTNPFGTDLCTIRICTIITGIEFSDIGFA